MEETKICKQCGAEKPITEFRKQKAAKCGLHPFCSVCHSAYSKKNYEDNKESRIKGVVEWQEKHPVKVKKYQAKWRILNEYLKDDGAKA